MWRSLWRISKNMNETRRGYDLSLVTHKGRFWIILVVICLLVFNLEWGFRRDGFEAAWIMRLMYPLLALAVVLEFVSDFSRLHLVSEGIAVTLFGKTLRQIPVQDIRFIGGFIGAKHSRFSKNLAVCTRSMEELAEEQERKTPKMLRNARTCPGWAKDQVGQLLLRYSTSIRSQFGFFRRDILLIEWSPERLELLLQMYPGVPWVDLTEKKKLDAERKS